MFKADGCNIEWLPSGIVTRENRIVTCAIEIWPPAVDAKTHNCMPIKEHGIDGEIVKKVYMAAFRVHDDIQRLWEIVADIDKFSTIASSTVQ